MHNESPSCRCVSVMVPVPMHKPLSYRVPQGTHVEPGSIVRVPLGPRSVAGIVWDGEPDLVDTARLKSIEHVFDCPAIDRSMRRFVDWIAEYTLSPPGMVARMLLRVPEALDPESPEIGLKLTEIRPERLTPARRRVIELAQSGLTWSATGLAHAAGVTQSVIRGLEKQGVLEPDFIAPRSVVAKPDCTYALPVLNDDQRAAVHGLSNSVSRCEFGVSLIDGVTGSGKTEVYFEAVADVLGQGKQVLILLPEISLTQVFLRRFEKRFGSPPAEWHSELRPNQRRRVWRQVADGQVRVVAGARSALYLPFRHLGLIVVDEEHDTAYKQEDRVHYNARDMAIVRGKIGMFPVILASATPSIESRVNHQRGRYNRIELPNRYRDANLPVLTAIDMRRHPPARGSFLSPILLEQTKKVIARKEQALLFLNRRGYAPLTLCRVCGHRFGCPDCSSWLVEHRFRGQLQCHHCGHFEPRPEACPECGTLDHLVACGPGIERIAEEIVGGFPDARVIVLSSDMPGGVKRLRLELDAIANGDADIVVGTQLVAKGHNFPRMTLVGVVDADLGLANGDPRAAERTFQLLNQVTGRAGRGGTASKGLIQTYQPEHPVMQAIISGDRDAFYEREIMERCRASLPPFGRLAGLIVSAASRSEAESHAQAMRRAAPADRDIRVLGPAEAPLAMLRGRYRFRLLVRGSLQADMQGYVRSLIQASPKERGSIRLQIDIDPQSFF